MTGPIGRFSLFRDFRNQISWGRVCAAVALVVAVWREFTGADIRDVALWLAVATGSYGTSQPGPTLFTLIPEELVVEEK